MATGNKKRLPSATLRAAICAQKLQKMVGSTRIERVTTTVSKHLWRFYGKQNAVIPIRSANAHHPSALALGLVCGRHVTNVGNRFQVLCGWRGYMDHAGIGHISIILHDAQFVNQYGLNEPLPPGARGGFRQ